MARRFGRRVLGGMAAPLTDNLRMPGRAHDRREEAQKSTTRARELVGGQRDRDVAYDAKAA